MKSEFKNLPSGWKAVRLKEISSRITRKNQDNKCQNVLTISAQSGLISQTDFFNKQVASKDLSSYILLKKGDFAYNKSYSAGYSFGAFKRLNFYDEGVASPLYIYFKFNDDICSDFFEFYFDGGQANRQIKDIVQEGARNHGLLNLSIDDFFNIKICTPPLDEQKKIAEILSTWDEAINLTINLIESKKRFKKALMQNLLTAKIRFPEFKDEWEEIRLGNIGKSYNGLIGKVAEDFQNGNSNFITYKNIFDNPKIDINIFEKVKIMEDEEQNLVKFGDIFFTTSSETPNEVGISSVLLSKCGILYLNSFCFGFRLNNFEILAPCFAVFYFRSDCFRKQIFKLAQGSTRFNISKTEVLNLNIKIPNLDEQQKIAEVLTSCDDEINLLNLKLENLKRQKQGLMQKLLSGKVGVRV